MIRVFKKFDSIEIQYLGLMRLVLKVLWFWEYLNVAIDR